MTFVRQTITFPIPEDKKKIIKIKISSPHHVLTFLRSLFSFPFHLISFGSLKLRSVRAPIANEKIHKISRAKKTIISIDGCNFICSFFVCLLLSLKERHSFRAPAAKTKVEIWQFNLDGVGWVKHEEFFQHPSLTYLFDFERFSGFFFLVLIMVLFVFVCLALPSDLPWCGAATNLMKITRKIKIIICKFLVGFPFETFFVVVLFGLLLGKGMGDK